MKEIMEGKINYDNRGNGSFYEWWEFNEDSSNKWMKKFEGKKVRITIELMED